VVNSSRAVHMPWADRAAAVLMTWFAGEQFGPALASVLVGREQPCGRLPITFPMRDEDIPGWGTGLGDDHTLDYDSTEPTGYRHSQLHDIAPRYPLGYGLGYTTFELTEAHLSGEAISATVRNTGDRSGRDVIQVYVKAPGEVDHRLAGYGTATVRPGESRTITIELDRHAYRRWSVQEGQWHVPRGTHQLRVGRSSVDLPIHLEVQR
jgi:beta-glucosidase